MMNFRLIEAAALALMLATPAMAMHRGYRHHYGRSVFNAYAFHGGHSFTTGNFRGDFDRRNTFN
jgi:hypothetical protein